MKDRLSELSELWFVRAEDDLSWAEDSFKDGHFGGTCFLSQQIVEKALKAYLFFQKQKLIRTHNLERLLAKCLEFDKQFIKLKKSCQILTDYYIDTRYPDIWDYNQFDDKKFARQALDLAKIVVEFLRKKLK